MSKEYVAELEEVRSAQRGLVTALTKHFTAALGTDREAAAKKLLDEAEAKLKETEAKLKETKAELAGKNGRRTSPDFLFARLPPGPGEKRGVWGRSFRVVFVIFNLFFYSRISGVE